MDSSIIIIFVIMILAAAASMQFYRGRKKNVKLMEDSIAAVTNIVTPEEKEFVWLGGYVGYRAYYKIKKDNIEEIDFTVTLVPRQSIFYYPIALLTTRHDRIYIVVYPLSKISREAHLIQEGYYHLSPHIENEPVLKKEDVIIGNEENGSVYKALYERRADAEKLKKFVIGLSNFRNVKHVSLTPSTNVFYVFMKLDVETLENDMKHIVKFVNEELVEN